MTTDVSNPLELDLQIVTDAQALPSRQDFLDWSEAALADTKGPRGLVVRVVDERESRELNKCYRGRNQPTNVLSFPFEAPAVAASNHLGDLVICAPVVAREAQEQHKPVAHHWAHMVIHGVLHLRGYDHEDDTSATQMESLEKQILEQLGIDDPYLESNMMVQEQ